MVNLEREIKARGLKAAFGPMTTMRNKRLLLKAVEEEGREVIEIFQVRPRARVQDKTVLGVQNSRCRSINSDPTHSPVLALFRTFFIHGNLHSE